MISVVLTVRKFTYKGQQAGLFSSDLKDDPARGSKYCQNKKYKFLSEFRTACLKSNQNYWNFNGSLVNISIIIKLAWNQFRCLVQYSVYKSATVSSVQGQGKNKQMFVNIVFYNRIDISSVIGLVVVFYSKNFPRKNS